MLHTSIIQETHMGKLIPVEDELIVKLPNHMENNPLCRHLSDTVELKT